MTPTDVIEILGSANPLPNGVAAVLPLQDGESELLREIVADRHGTTVRAARVQRRVRRKFALGLAVAAVAVAVVTVVPFGGGGGGPTPAFAAALVRFANSTP